MRDPAERLRDILEAIAVLDRYANRDSKAFEKDELLQGWFLRRLQIIGEAARALPDDVRAPWLAAVPCPSEDYHLVRAALAGF